MKLIILKTNLVEALNSVERAISESSDLPILKNFVLKIEENQISLISTNLELAIKHLITGKILETGEISIPFQIFNSIIKNLNSERISLEIKGKNLFINTDNYEANINCQDYGDFPIIPQIKNQKNFFKIKSGDFIEAINSIIGATQFSDIRPEISGVFLNLLNKEMVLAATDGFRLAEINIKSKIESDIDEVKLIIPLKTAQEIIRVFNKTDEDMGVFMDENQILFKTKNKEIISRLIGGNFPEYKTIIPKEVKTDVYIDRIELINAVKVASVFSSKTNEIVLKTEKNKKAVEISAISDSLGKNTYKIPAKIKGEEFSMVLNWRYFLDGLKIYKSEEVFLGINNSNKPIVIKSLTEPFLIYILMPIKN